MLNNRNRWATKIEFDIDSNDTALVVGYNADIYGTLRDCIERSELNSSQRNTTLEAVRQVNDPQRIVTSVSHPPIA